MLTLYLFALVVGGGLLAFSLIGGHDHGGDLHGDVGDHALGNAFHFLSLRTLTYFLFVFGGVGAVLTWSWKGWMAPLVLLLAAAAGVGIGALVSFAFKYLRQTDSGDRHSEDSFVGLPARVTLPIPAGGMGKVLVHRGDRTFELLARPHDGSAPTSGWKSVVVVEMNRGVALVAPLDPALQDSNL
jgi:hypothetical protein